MGEKFIHQMKTKSGLTNLDIREIAAITEDPAYEGEIAIHMKSGTIFTIQGEDDLTTLMGIAAWLRSGGAFGSTISGYPILQPNGGEEQ